MENLQEKKINLESGTPRGNECYKSLLSEEAVYVYQFCKEKLYLGYWQTEVG